MTNTKRTRLFFRWSTIALAATFALASSCKKADDEKPAEEISKPATAPKVQPDTPSETVPVAGGDLGSSLADAAGTFKLDPGHSVVIFRGKHYGVGYTYGRFNKVEGVLSIDADPSKSSVQIEVDAGSVFSGIKKRDDHLLSPDFLNAAQFPTISFASTAVKAVGPNKYEVTGDLTLHGVTKSVKSTFEHVGVGPNPMNPKETRTGFWGELSIDSKDYEIKGLPGAVGEKIDLIISVEGAR